MIVLCDDYYIISQAVSVIKIAISVEMAGADGTCVECSRHCSMRAVAEGFFKCGLPLDHGRPLKYEYNL